MILAFPVSRSSLAIARAIVHNLHFNYCLLRIFITVLTTVLRYRFLDFTYSRMGHVSRSRYFALASFMLVFGLLHASICLVSIYLL